MSILTNLESLDDQDLALLILSHLVRYDLCRQEVSGYFWISVIIIPIV